MALGLEVVALVLAEKPSVARDLAQSLGANRRGDGYIHGNNYIVTWAIGHLVALPEPQDIHESWAHWRAEDLPLLPEKWPLRVISTTKDQFATIQNLLARSDVEKVICATDAGREGELIFRYIYEKAGCVKPVERLWISSLTQDAIRKGFSNLTPGSDWDRLADAARARSRADWLVGMNLSRAYSLRWKQNYSVGRVQTPTLAMLSQREKEIQAFQPEDYWHLKGVGQSTNPKGRLPDLLHFRPEHREFAKLKAGQFKAHRFSQMEGEAQDLADALEGSQVEIVYIAGREQSQQPPLLYDLTELQRRANRAFGLPAAKTLSLAQSLYEKHKLISYPRTDSRYLTQTVADQLDGILPNILEPYADLLQVDPLGQALPSRFVNDEKAKEHHAIIPTGRSMPKVLNEDEKKIYDLIVRRLLAAWQPPYRSRTSQVVVEASTSLDVDPEHPSPREVLQPLFFAKGLQVLEWGYKEVANERKAEERRLKPLPGFLSEGLVLDFSPVTLDKRTTMPPPRLNDAALLTAMETAGQQLDDSELKSLMRDHGLGTAATRANIIDTLIKRQYIERREKVFYVTDKGMALIETVAGDVKSPMMTGQWEAKFKEIEQGRLSCASFMSEMASYVTESVREALRGQPPPALSKVGPSTVPQHEPAPGKRKGAMAGPDPKQVWPAEIVQKTDGLQGASQRAWQPPNLDELLRQRFGFNQFRPHQRDVCQEVTDGRDLLLVMPTGAGKSLCYQLPGLARPGTALVISPLIALIEDQVSKLQQMGLKAERIHSGRDRSSSNQACRRYIRGELDYLFVAPERLGISGFLSLLSQHKPCLVAIDEAHCISHWGHDFRPDYRLLGERLPHLRPAPIVALTATATPLVQKDISEQLGLQNPSLHIHGFRRQNIAIEAVEMPVNRRLEAVIKLLEDPERRPAIIYTQSRALSEEVAENLQGALKVRPYHAGMPNEERQKIQDGFLSGELEVIAATIAFGMGVDKADIRTVVHMALPGSVENFYQEIGRAGRDGKPSRAVLFHSFADYRHHEFFLEKNYPGIDLLHRIVAHVPKKGIFKHELQAIGDPDEIENAIEKLWIHGGLKISPEEHITPGDEGWESKYKAQREHREDQIRRMGQLAKSSDVCRMLMLIQHFGDLLDSREPCGQCDVCQPESSFFKIARAPNENEIAQMDYLISYLLKKGEGLSKGKVFREVFEHKGVKKEVFEAWTSALVSAGFLQLSEAQFKKGGRTINYWTMHLAKGFRPIDIPWDKVKVPDLGIELREVRAKKRVGASTKKSKAKTRKEVVAPVELDSALLKRLKSWRLEEARKKKIPAFCILSDRTLNEIAADRPLNKDQLLSVGGMGPGKFKKYGASIIKMVNQ